MDEREEQIHKSSVDWGNGPVCGDEARGFVMGARWADANPVRPSTLSVRLKSMSKMHDRIYKECFWVNAGAKRLKKHLALAVEALEKLGPAWLYWPSAKVNGAFESRQIKEIEELAKNTLEQIRSEK